MSKLNRYIAYAAYGDAEFEFSEDSVPIYAKNKKDALKIMKKGDPCLDWTIYSIDEWFEKFGIIHED